MTTLHIDFETHSTVDLTKTGVYIYAGHATTDVWCMAYAFDDGPIEVWRPGEPLPADVINHIALRFGRVVGHNVGFEWAIWNAILVPRCGFPALPIDICYCTMAMACAMALPRSLAQATMAVGLDQAKDMDGRRLMLQMAKPRRIEDDGTIVWWDEPVKIKRLIEYCMQDVEAERGLEKRLLPLRDEERRVWLLDHKINTRGIMVDLATVDAAERLVSAASDRLNAQMNDVTGGAVKKCTNVRDLIDWLNEQGVKTKSIAKQPLTDLLAGDLPNTARRALELRREGSKSSTAKLKAMRLCASGDGRARGLFIYHGANTGRWSGTRIQTQNLPRPTRSFSDIEDIIQTIGETA